MSSVPPRSLRALLAEIDTETALLYSRLASLAAERKAIVEALRSVIYPAILDIPTEITAGIFLQYVTTAQIGGNHSNLVPSCGPLLLASICRRWRQIALSLQPIWSKFRIVTESRTFGSVEKLLEHWLPRAGEHPLTVSLRAWNSTLLASLGRHLSNLQELCCAFDPQTGFPSDLFQGRISNLRRLQLIANTIDPPDLETPITAFTGCAQLREVVLDACLRPWLHLPWSQLTRLELRGIYDDQCIDILRSTPAVETLTLYLISVDEIDLSEVPVRLVYLQTLKIDQNQTGLDIFRVLDVPALTHIEFSLAPTEEHPSISVKTMDFMSLVKRSTCKLCSITLFGAQFREAVQCLRTAGPSLAVVKMHDIEWRGEQFKTLFEELEASDAQAHTPLLPNLTSISFNPCLVAANVPYVELVAMLASRRPRDTGHGGRNSDADGTRTVARLESFEFVLDDLSIWKDPTLAEMDECLDTLKALQADGLDMNSRTIQRLSLNAMMDAAAVYPTPSEWLDDEY